MTLVFEPPSFLNGVRYLKSFLNLVCSDDLANFGADQSIHPFENTYLGISTSLKTDEKLLLVINALATHVPVVLKFCLLLHKKRSLENSLPVKIKIAGQSAK